MFSENAKSPENTKHISRIAIIGVGQVGAAAAYTLVLGSVASELLLVDVKVDLRDGQVRDISDVAFSRNSTTRVRAATYHEAGHCDIVVITAGSKCPMGETSGQHVYRNTAIIQNVITAMMPFRSDTILLVVTNPVDLITDLARRLSGLPSSQVLGTGTFLDSVRLRGLLADKVKVAANSIDLYVLGVQGDSQVVAWSTATIGGVPFEKSLHPNAFNQTELESECKHRSQTIIQAKGSTPYGISSIVYSICSSILFDKRNVRPVSSYQSEYSCCLSLPVILGRKGVIRMIQMPLNDDEKAKIAESANILRDAANRISATW